MSYLNGKERNILIDMLLLTIKKKTLSFVNLLVTTLIKVAHKCFQHFSLPYGSLFSILF